MSEKTAYTVYPSSNIAHPSGNTVYTNGSPVYPSGKPVYPSGNRSSSTKIIVAVVAILAIGSLLGWVLWQKSYRQLQSTFRHDFLLQNPTNDTLNVNPAEASLFLTDGNILLGKDTKGSTIIRPFGSNVFHFNFDLSLPFPRKIGREMCAKNSAGLYAKAHFVFKYENGGQDIFENSFTLPCV